MERNTLAEQMEIIGELYEIDGMEELLDKFVSGMTLVKFNAVVIRVCALLLKTNKKLADKILAVFNKKTDKQIQALDDSEYAVLLKETFIGDIMGFFPSSPSTDGKK